ncbi:MAG: UvrD-helicase domain-containing protein [Candidatus Delongbacteria bacterium]|nr:UvrD-helicase domain-containing protein [Candidatus Delongbacteria bacterium]MBN2834065.1 UvrD-helicase domain-containing protein [Candidatus Delongbacteria bacterium]
MDYFFRKIYDITLKSLYDSKTKIVILLPDQNITNLFKTKYIEWLYKEKISHFTIPDIQTIFTFAKKINRIKTGDIIRIEDFIQILKNSDLLPSYLLKDNILSYFFELCDLSFQNKNSINQKIGELDLQDSVDEIIDYIKSFNFKFRSSLFDNLNKGDSSCHKIIIPFTLRENSVERNFLESFELIKLYEEKSIFNKNEISDLYFGNTSKFVNNEKIKISTFDNANDYILAIINLIDTLSNTYSLNDISIICSKLTKVTITSELFSRKIPCRSSLEIIKPSIGNTLLNFTLAVLNNDTTKLYEIINIDLEEIIEKYDFDSIRLNSQFSILDLIKNIEKKKLPDDAKLLPLLKMCPQNNSTISVDKFIASFSSLFQKIEKLLGIDSEINFYTFKDNLSLIFPDKTKITDILKYLTSINSSKKILYTDSLGVSIYSTDEFILPSKIMILMDQTEGTFLTKTNYNKLLGENTYNQLIEKIRGTNDRDWQILNLKECLSYEDCEKYYFMIPLVNSNSQTYRGVENIISSFGEKELECVVLNTDIKFKHRFPYSISELNQTPFYYHQKLGYSEHRNANENFYIINEDYKITEKISSVSKLEKFLSCPYSFIYDAISESDKIEDNEIYDKGNRFHELIQHFLNCYSGKKLLDEDYIRYVSYFLNSNNNPDPKKIGFIASKLVEYYLGKEIDEEFIFFKELFLNEEFISIFPKFYKLSGDHIEDSDLKKEIYNIFKFLIRLLIWMGKTPIEVTQTFKTEVVFNDFYINDKIKIKSGYIDFIYIDNDNCIRIIDLKSGSIKSYSEEMDKYNNIQLLVYSEIFRTAIKNNDYSHFENVAEYSRRIKSDFSEIDKDYFIKYNIDTIKTFYLSPNSDCFEVECTQVYDQFLETLDEKIEKLPFYYSSYNKNCSYCPHKNVCPTSDNKIQIDKFPCNEEKREFNLPYYYEIPKANKKQKKIIQFEGEKKRALEIFDRDIVISAGAGAGKTEVLSAKYLRLLIDRNLSLDEIVCITFTNKAVGEMKKRIYEKLTDLSSICAEFSLPKGSDFNDYKLDASTINQIKNQLVNFHDRNNIFTFHSFCKKILDEYSSYTITDSGYDLDSKLIESSILFPELLKITKRVIAKRSVFLNIQEKGIFDLYFEYVGGGKDADGKLYHSILDILNKLEQSDNFNFNVDYDDLKEYSLPLIEELSKDYYSLKKEIIDLATYLKPNAKKTSDVDSYSKILNNIEQDKKIDSLRTRKNDEEHSRLANLISELKNTKFYLLFVKTETEDLDDENATFLYSALNKILKNTSLEIKKYKKENNILEQHDLHINMLNLLENESVLEKIKSRYRYFMIDEFQDTNWLSKRIVDTLTDSNTKKFIVGDLKQSIYSFQQCDNNIFKIYMNDEQTEYLKFTENFRSAPAIINFNNYYFSENSFPAYNIFLSTSKTDPEYAVSPYSNPCNSIIEFSEFYYSKQDYETLSTEELNRITKLKEAEYIANLIKNDGNYGKWGILVRKYTNVDMIINALNDLAIPCAYVKKKDLFYLREVQDFLSVLHVVTGRKRYLSLGYLTNWIEEKDLVGLSFNTIPEAVSFILNLESFKIYLNSRYSTISLRNVYENIREYFTNLWFEYDSISTFFDELNKIIGKNLEGIEWDVSDSVKIMTVHSSKGLEFDNLIIANISDRSMSDRTKFNFMNIPESNPRKTFFIPKNKKDVDGNNSVYKIFFSPLYEQNNSDREDEELANLLYVAFTRAKNNLYVTLPTGSLPKTENNGSEWRKNIVHNIFRSNNIEYESNTKCKMSFNNYEFEVLVNRIEISSFSSDNPKEKSIEIFSEMKLNGNYPRPDNLSVTSVLSGKSSSEETDFIKIGNYFHQFMEEIVTYKEFYNYSTYLDNFLFENRIDKKYHSTLTKFAKNSFENKLFSNMVSNGKDFLCEMNLLTVIDENPVQGYADLVIFCSNEIWVIDYKTKMKFETNDDQMDKYRKQLKAYSDSLQFIYKDYVVKSGVFIITKDKAELLILEDTLF